MGKTKKRTILSLWLGRLSAEQAAVYEPSVRALETGFSLIGFALQEGLEHKDTGSLRASREAAELAGELAGRHGALLYGAVVTMERRSRHFGTLPEVDPLDPETFRSDAARTESMWNAMLHRMLFSARQRWFHKLVTLKEILWDVRETFLETAGELAEGVSLEPMKGWALLEQTHDDWNTCLRETTILLKCLLTALAPGEVEELRRELEEKRKRAEEQPSEWRERRKRKARTTRREGHAKI